ATAVRAAMVGTAPVFAMPELRQPGMGAMATYVLVGAASGLVATFATRAVYAIEDGFEKLPLHWMWWPALGAVAVGVIGVFAPRTLGVGYDNIEALLSGDIVGAAAVSLCVLKFASWSIALGSGTSGGTLAPLLTIGSGFGALAGAAAVAVLPGLGIDPRLAALVGMAAVFAGASRAVLASVVFAFETTRQPVGLLPLLGGCAASYLVSALLMRHSIMTEKLARRGARVPDEYSADFLAHVLVRDHAAKSVVTLQADDTLAQVRARVTDGAAAWKHQGFPVVDGALLIGVVTRRDLLDGSPPPEQKVRQLVRRPPAVVFEDSSLREAADHMVREGVGRLPVVRRDEPGRVVGIITRSDLLAAHARRLENERAS
ncbi:MAG TPA: chloride channel protein, partial [Myxococcales bacterium]|nr:chloride channel protein [Myxococcales bacterium]